MRAATGPSSIPSPRPAGQGIGVKASTAMSSAPKSAMRVITSMPLTHAAVEVERAMANVSRKTITADHTTPPPIDDRAPSHRRPGASCRRELGDTDCISRPDQARKVVALAHYVKVDVLAEVEARVLVRAAKAAHVEVKHDQCRATASHRLQQLDPGGIGARCDDGD